MTTDGLAQTFRQNRYSDLYSVGEITSFGRHGGAYSARYRLDRVETVETKKTVRDVVADATAPRGWRWDVQTVTHKDTYNIWVRVA
jgi:hypothetical protein